MANGFELGRAINTPLSFGAPEHLSIGDFDGDGLGDVAVASPAGDRFQLGIYLNDGDQTFTEATVLNDVPEQDALAVADLNGDGRDDLVQASSAAGAVTVLFGDGQGGVASRGTLNPTHNPKSLELADVDGDGHRDILAGTNNRGGVAVFLGDGAGGFTQAAGLVEGVRRTNSLETGDFNGDGLIDVVAHDDGRNGTVQLLAGDGAGGFALANTIEMTDDISRPRDLGVGDFDNDGNLDWAVPELARDRVEVFYGDGAGGVARRVELDTDANPRTIDVADFDRDGEADLAVGHGGSQTVRIYAGQADGGFAPAEDAAINGDGDNVNEAAAGDLDGDGFPDLVLSNATEGGLLSAMENQGGAGLPELSAELAWTRQIGTGGNDVVIDSATAADGDLIVVGHENVRSDDQRVFVKKFDAQGNEVWSQRFGNDSTKVNAVELDDQGNVYFSGSVTLGQVGSLDNHFSTLNSGTGNFNGTDPYLAKFAPTGEQEWFQRFGSPDVDGDHTDLAVGDDGTVYVSARATGPFVPAHSEPGTANDVAISAFSGGGDLQWSKLIGAEGGSDNAAEIALDPSSGALVVAGRTSGDFGTLTTGGGDDFRAAPNFVGQADNDHRGFYLRLDPDAEGQVTQVRQFEFRTGDDTIDGLTVNERGEVTIAGDTGGLDAGRGVPVASVQIPYARRFDAEGEAIWTRQDSSRNDVGIGQDGYSGLIEGPFGYHYASGGAQAHVGVYDDAGRLRADITETIFSQAGGTFDDGATTLAGTGDALYLGGGTVNGWAGTPLGDRDGWIGRLELSLSEPSGPDLDLLSLQDDEAVSAMYVAWFGRAPQIAGQDFWAGEFADGVADGKSAGRTLQDIAESFRVGGEAGNLYPFLDNRAPGQAQLEGLVTDLYDNLFDRAPSRAGLDFWTGEIADRLARDAPIGDIVFDVISGARNDVLLDTDGDGQGDARFNDAATVLNRIEVATAYGNAVDADDFDRTESARLIGGVGTGGLGRDDALDAVNTIAGGGEPDLATAGNAADPLLA